MIMINPSVMYERVENVIYILSPKDSEEGGEIIVLDEIAAEIWSLLDQFHSEDEIIDELAGIYDVPLSELQNDVKEFIANLVEQELVKIKKKKKKKKN